LIKEGAFQTSRADQIITGTGGLALISLWKNMGK
jgi:hypothetical protein